MCFVHFELEMCFAPQRRTLFRHRHFQKWSEREVFLAFTYKCALRPNGVQFFIAHLTTWLRTRSFSEVTFRPSGATNHWKNTVNSFSSLIFSLLNFSSLTLPTSAFPSLHIV